MDIVVGLKMVALREGLSHYSQVLEKTRTTFVICQKADWHFLDEMTNLLNRGQVALQAENRTRLVKPQHKI